MIHVGFVLFLLWLLSAFNCCHLAAYFISLIYLYLVILTMSVIIFSVFKFNGFVNHQITFLNESCVFPFEILRNLDTSHRLASLKLHFVIWLNLPFFLNEVLLFFLKGARAVLFETEEEIAIRGEKAS